MLALAKVCTVFSVFHLATSRLLKFQKLPQTVRFIHIGTHKVCGMLILRAFCTKGIEWDEALP